jgi:hypothetical protein
LAAAALAVLSASAASAEVPAENWSETLAADARALRQTYFESHPGTVDSENPDFKKQLEAGLALAQERARSVNSFGAYWWAMREYIAAFNDGHVYIETTSAAPELPVRWPGFLTREVAGKHVVATGEGLPGLPSVGSQLISCDGIGADQLAADLVGRFRGRWNLGSQHETHAWRLFLDAGNPYVALPKRCVFTDGRTQQTVDLSYKPMSKELFQQESGKASAVYRGPTDVRQFGADGLWISLGSFSGDTSTERGKAISALVKGLEQDQARLARAAVIVLDVRGNGGGSSKWGDKIAALLWGKRIADAAKPQSAGIDWRPSKANIAAVEDYARGPGVGLFTRMFIGQVVSGMKAALAAGQPLWREKAPPRVDTAAREAPRQVSAGSRKVYILADGGCASACLDAMDVWTRAGAIPVGRETSADSLYMEIRKQTLPSGLATITVPMKVYRGRVRGLNVSYKPVHEFGDDMMDQQAVETWIASLASR